VPGVSQLEKDMEQWAHDDWRHRLQLGVSGDWKLPVEEYRCPDCGSLHTAGWACMPWKQEAPHIEMEC
jgi:hypothetical protein